MILITTVGTITFTFKSGFLNKNWKYINVMYVNRQKRSKNDAHD